MIEKKLSRVDPKCCSHPTDALVLAVNRAITKPQIVYIQCEQCRHMERIDLWEAFRIRAHWNLRPSDTYIPADDSPDMQ